jgi:hypothetical protein
LNFEAAFEEEHGVGVLTDGQTILAIGYSHDATPSSSRDGLPRELQPPQRGVFMSQWRREGIILPSLARVASSTESPAR